MTFDDQAENIIEFADQHSLERFTLVGQSMGGRAAMKCALRHPDRVQAVLSVDAPACNLDKWPGFIDRTYEMVKFLASFDPAGKTYGQIQAAMKKQFGDDEENIKRIMRNFRYTNSEGTTVEWKSNPKYILDNIETMYYFEPIAQFKGPAKMLVNGKSNRYKLEHYKDCFPNLTEKDVITVPNTGHWIHTDDAEATTKHVLALLKESE